MMIIYFFTFITVTTGGENLFFYNNRDCPSTFCRTSQVAIRTSLQERPICNTAKSCPPTFCPSPLVAVCLKSRCHCGVQELS
ncbi:hypothetical protein P8452_13186 [Trifolium repens]|nr:hypothetical protein P8452_13186 [Trifolium repens]